MPLHSSALPPSPSNLPLLLVPRLALLPPLPLPPASSHFLVLSSVRVPSLPFLSVAGGPSLLPPSPFPLLTTHPSSTLPALSPPLSISYCLPSQLARSLRPPPPQQLLLSLPYLQTSWPFRILLSPYILPLSTSLPRELRRALLILLTSPTI